jgi:tetratricopeptide (TPR) repeat protein
MKILIASVAILSFTGLAWADELDDAYQALKEAQTNKKADDVKKWAVETSKLARAEAARQKPAEMSNADWKARTDYAKQVDTFAEYALSVTAMQSGLEAEKTVELMDALLDLNPKSQYLAQSSAAYLAAAAKLGPAKQIDAANKLLKANPNSEDALFTLAEGTMNKSPDQAFAYANRLVAAVRNKAKPEGFTEADWERKKSLMLGHGYYIAGVTSCVKQGWADCDRNLRAAVPLVGKDPTMGGVTYFYLGLSNYQLGKMIGDRTKIQEGQKFSEQSAAMPGAMQQQASRNAAAMKQELGTPRR